jgi:hypothetical protein
MIMTLNRALEKYNHRRFGPVLGISDEGSAAQTIAEAGYASAKAWAVANPDADIVGLIFDGERMGSAGEVPIGPDEYAKFIPATEHSIFCSTNVGVRVNTRIHQPLPEYRVADAKANETAWLDSIFAKFKPFIFTPDGIPRPLTVRLVIEGASCKKAVRKLVPKLEAGRADGRLGSAGTHRLSLLSLFDHEIGKADVAEIESVVKLASELGVPEVAIDGVLVEGARRRISVQGLLNILDSNTAKALLAHAKAHGVALVYHYEVDPETAARTVWTGLNSAFRSGLTAGKYGLLPLQLREQEYVVRNVQKWMKDWTPVPAFYVDTPLVTDDDVYGSDRVVEGAKIWMSMVAANGASVVLIDAPDRISPRKLLKRDPSDPKDPGVLTLADIAVLVDHANKLGLKALWSGGISAPQAFELGKLQVFGFFTTGSTARIVAVEDTLAGDKQLAAETEPTALGVRRIHGLAQAGYLISVLGDRELRDEIEACATMLLKGDVDGEVTAAALEPLNSAMIRGWKAYWSQGASGGVKSKRSVPVAPDAVRVWRGFRLPSLDDATFCEKLGSVFIPGTVQIQAPVGLTAYLPTVLPRNKPAAAPDEIAIVFYEVQDAYHDAKKTVGGRAYSDLHGLVFDLTRSTSGFPIKFVGKVEADMRYHLFDAHVDWQAGVARAFVGMRKKGDDGAGFLELVAKWLGKVQTQKDGPDGAIAVADKNYVTYWEHWPDEASSKRSLIPTLAAKTTVAYDQPIPPQPLDEGLWQQYDGVTVKGGESFNMQYRRRKEG